MKRIKITVSAFVVALASSAVIASGASASAPEWGQCVPTAPKTGEYIGTKCLVPDAGKGGSDWRPEPTGKAILTGVGEGIVLETPAKRKITCAASTYTGTFTGPKTATVTIDLIGCNTFAGTTKQECQSSPVPQKESEIEAEYEAELGFIKSGEKPIVGLDIKPKSTITFTCGKLPEVGLSGEIEGSVIGQIIGPDGMRSEYKLVHKETAGKQAVQSFEGQPKDTLTAKLTEGTTMATEELGLRQTSFLSAEEEEIEVRTRP